MEGTLTRVRDFHDRSASFLRKIGIYAGPSSYATGGDPFTAADCGLGTIDAVFLTPATNGTATLIYLYDATNEKIMCFDMAGAETVATTDLDAYLAYIEVLGH